MITPELKDIVLNSFINVGIYCEQDIHEAQSDYGISPDEFELIVDQFESLNLIHVERFLGGLMRIQLTADAFDLSRRGGFVGQEKLIQTTIEKLRLEVEQLQKSFPEKAQLYTTILANLGTIGAFFIHK